MNSHVELAQAEINEKHTERGCLYMHLPGLSKHTYNNCHNSDLKRLSLKSDADLGSGQTKQNQQGERCRCRHLRVHIISTYNT
jgi:hypothetical protein